MYFYRTNEFANITTEIQSAVAAAERIFNLLDKESEPEDAPTQPRLSTLSATWSLKTWNSVILKGRPC